MFEKKIWEFLSHEQRETYRAISIREPPEWRAVQQVKKQVAVYAAGIAGAILLGVMSLLTAGPDYVTSIKRGEESKSQVLVVEREERESMSMELTVEPPKPDEALVLERLALGYEAAFTGVERWLGGEGNDPFPTVIEIAEEELLVTWQCSDPLIISQPDARMKELGAESEEITLGVRLSFRGEVGMEQRTYRITGWTETWEELARKELSLRQEAERDREDWILPEQLGGEEVKYRLIQDKLLAPLAALLVIASLLGGIAIGSQPKEELKKRSAQMQRDYPEIVMKLSILLKAGLSIPQSLIKVGEGAPADHYAYAEIKKFTAVAEKNGYDRRTFSQWGRRCRHPSYIRLANLLAQSMTLGVGELSERLAAEAGDAFQNRKQAARQEGQRLGARLLGPIMGMFVIILVMIIVPVFCSM